MCPFRNTKAPTTKLKHFRHEGQAIDLRMVIQRRQNLIPGANLDPISCP
jgi:hypothetical protein